MSANRVPDQNNREQVLEFGLQTHTAPDGTKMGAPARVQVNSAGTPVENTEGTLLASAARTATTNSPNQTNYNARGVLVSLTVTVASGLGGLIVKINTIAPNSNAWVQLNPNITAITTTGTYAYLVYPGATSTNGMQQTITAPLPRSWVVQVAHGDATSYTYSVGYSYNI